VKKTSGENEGGNEGEGGAEERSAKRGREKRKNSEKTSEREGTSTSQSRSKTSEEEMEETSLLNTLGGTETRFGYMRKEKAGPALGFTRTGWRSGKKQRSL